MPAREAAFSRFAGLRAFNLFNCCLDFLTCLDGVSEVMLFESFFHCLHIRLCCILRFSNIVQGEGQCFRDNQNGGDSYGSVQEMSQEAHQVALPQLQALPVVQSKVPS